MFAEYSQFLTRLSAIIQNLQGMIVEENFFLKIVFLIALVFLKIFFAIAALPFFLMAPAQFFSKDTSKKFTGISVNTQRFQQAVILTFFSLLVLFFGLRTVIVSIFSPPPQAHEAAAQPMTFTGTRSNTDAITPSIQHVTVSSLDQSVTFEGTGPAYARVALIVDNGTSFVYNTQVNDHGNWTFTQTSQAGNLSAGMHSVFAVFYGDDNTVIGTPTVMKTFTITSSAFFMFFRSLESNIFTVVFLILGILGFSILKLKSALSAFGKNKVLHQTN